jgi:2-iminobutanoate/2-iminopropanoate deaminase
MEGSMFQVIQTDKAPAAIGPYSQALISGNIMFASGQIPINPENGQVVEGDITVQATQVMKNVGAILEAAGLSYDNVIKTTCFLKSMDDFTAFNEVYAQYFTGKPARSCVAAAKLPKDVLCEVEVIAILN